MGVHINVKLKFIFLFVIDSYWYADGLGNTSEVLTSA